MKKKYKEFEVIRFKRVDELDEDGGLVSTSYVPTRKRDLGYAREFEEAEVVALNSTCNVHGKYYEELI